MKPPLPRSPGAIAGALLALPLALWLEAVEALAAQPGRATVVYKQAGGVDIKMDVFADDAAKPRPAVVWIHGGGLINGHREQLSGQVRDFASANGFALVSLDYQLHEIENGEHGLGGGDPEQIQQADRKGFEFVKRHLEQP